MRLCVDYRKVNELVKPDRFTLLRIQDCLDAVAGSNMSLTIPNLVPQRPYDLTSGYYQVPLKEDDIPKSAFVCRVKYELNYT